MSDRLRFSADYWRFWTAAALSNLGDGMRLAALPLAAVSVTTEPIAVTTVAALAFLPWVLAGPVAGVVVDRVDRRKLMILGQIARGVVVFGLALVIAGGQLSLPGLYAAAFLLGLGEVFVDTASQAAIPMLAPAGPGGLEAANGRLIAAETVLNEVVGAPVGAFLFAVGAAIPFFGDAASFLLGVVLLSMVRTPLQSVREDAPARVLTEIWEGLVLLWRHRLLRGLAVGVGLINITLSAMRRRAGAVGHRRSRIERVRVRVAARHRRRRRRRRVAAGVASRPSYRPRPGLVDLTVRRGGRLGADGTRSERCRRRRAPARHHAGRGGVQRDRAGRCARRSPPTACWVARWPASG